VICAGTSATGAFQNVVGVGNAGEQLTSNGPGLLPTWQPSSTVTPAALTRVDDTNVTLTLGGTPTTALLQATSITAGWAGQLSLARGGTNKNITADNGAIVYSDADSFELLAATATAGQVMRSGANAAPTWSTATYPTLAGSSGNVLTSDGTNWNSTAPANVSPLTTKGDLYTFTTLNARLAVGTTNGQMLQVNSGAATGLAWSTATYPSTATNVARLLRSDATNWVETTSTFADTYAASSLLYANGANNVAGLATANNGVLITSAGGVPSISSTLPSGIAASGMLLTSPRLITSVLDTNGNNLATITATGSAVNYMTWANAAAAGSPLIAVAGSDANIALQLSGKGTGGVVVQGATNGANVAAGYKGETTEANLAGASATSLVTSTAKNVTSISLTAGNWIITGNAVIQSSVASTQQLVWVSATSATLPDISLRNGIAVATTNTYFGCQSYTLIARPTTTTTYYLSAYSVFASGTSTACGQITATRI
jgi:hypothetical protein